MLNRENSAFFRMIRIADNDEGLACLGFDHEGSFVADPFSSACGRFPMDPNEYDLTIGQGNFIKGFNESLERATEAALTAGTKAMQDFLGVETGDFAGDYFAGTFEKNKIRHALALYALEEYDRKVGHKPAD